MDQNPYEAPREPESAHPRPIEARPFGFIASVLASFAAVALSAVVGLVMRPMDLPPLIHTAIVVAMITASVSGIWYSYWASVFNERRR
jgi:hypothetical protein